MQSNRKNHYILKFSLPNSVAPKERKKFSDYLGIISPIFHCKGIVDWQVTINNRNKILASESEFIDLAKLAPRNPPFELWFEDKKFATACKKILTRVFPKIQLKPVVKEKKKDWMREWRKYYKPVYFGKNGESLWIIPAWEKLQRVHKLSPAIKINPGQAFGTGTHPTTALCIELFLEISSRMIHKKRIEIIDFGAGTGILGMAAFLWARKKNIPAKLFSVESDPVAIKNLEKNITLNSIPASIGKKMPQNRKADIVFANILSPVLIEHRKALLSSIAPGGYLIISGILKRESKIFLQNFKDKSFTLKNRGRKEWAAFLFTRPF